MTKLAAITFTPHEKWHIPTEQEQQIMLTRNKQGTTPGRDRKQMKPGAPDPVTISCHSVTTHRSQLFVGSSRSQRVVII